MKKIKLSDIPKVDIFQGDEKYLDALPEKIDQRIAQREREKKAKHVSFPAYWKVIGYATAAAIAIFILVLVKDFSDKPNQVDELLAEVSSEDVMNYLKSTDLEIEDMVQQGMDIDLQDMNEDSLYFIGDDDMLLEEYLQNQYPGEVIQENID
jgi:hypothetical protein